MQTLKHALIANAVFSALSGLSFIVFGGAVAALIGIGPPFVYQLIGAGLLIFASSVFWVATRSPIQTFVALLISIADLLWVLGTALVIIVAYPDLNSFGILLMLAIAGLVLFFALRQLYGINQVYAVPGKANASRLCVSIDTPQPAECLWPFIADLAGIRKYSPSLSDVILRNNANPGVNAVRQCTNHKGQVWAEHCIAYDNSAHHLEMTFLADEPGFPYPFKTMSGGWEVKPKSQGSTVNIWFEVTPKHPLLHPMLLAIMGNSLGKSFGEVVTRMVIAASGQPVPESVSLQQQGISYRLAGC